MSSNSLQEMLARRRVLGPAYRLFYEEPLQPVRGEDVWLFDIDGRRYLDAYNNVPVVGHCHPEVVQALARQAALLNTHTRYLHGAVLDYAERLLAHFPAPLDTVMFTCTGSEANDLALRIARAVTGGSGVVVSTFAYHGVTMALAQMSPSLAPIGDYVRTVSPPLVQPGETGSDAGERFGKDVELAFGSLVDAGIRPAALLIDTVFASDGVVAPEPHLFDAAAAATAAAGALFVADEVQAGFGRLGADWWGFQRAKASPDIVTMGKPMGNGHPMGAVVTSADCAKGFADQGRYFNTFGGNPVSAAVGLAVLNLLEKGLPKQVEVLGTALGLALSRSLRGLGCRSVRGCGLYWGLELEERGSLCAGERARRVMSRMKQKGVLVGACGGHGESLKIRPPLTFRSEHSELLVDTLLQVLADI